MKHTRYLLLFILILFINSAPVKSTSSNRHIENIININTGSNNATIPDNNAISDVFVTVPTDITPKTNSTDFEDAKDAEKDNEVDRSNEVGQKNTYRTVIPSFPNRGIDGNDNFKKGYFGGYYFLGTDDTYFFSHGKYQKPTPNYYGNYNHTLKDNSSLGYYLGYAMNKMDHNEYFRHHNFTHFNIHHYFYMNSTMLAEQDVGSDLFVFCAKNTSTFCPENTEAICLLNSTVWCATKQLFVKPCDNNDVKQCVTTRIPCIKSDSFNCHHLLEVIKLPCISRIRILDVYEDKHGLTFNNVAGTFVLSPVSPISERTYCITIVAEPTRNNMYS